MHGVNTRVMVHFPVLEFDTDRDILKVCWYKRRSIFMQLIKRTNINTDYFLTFVFNIQYTIPRYVYVDCRYMLGWAGQEGPPALLLKSASTLLPKNIIQWPPIPCLDFKLSKAIRFHLSTVCVLYLCSY